MVGKTLISGSDKLFIKPLLIRSTFITGNQDNTGSVDIKRIRYAPDTTIMIKSKLFHFGVLRAVQCVCSWSAQLRS